jgi:hypothetical protein
MHRYGFRYDVGRFQGQVVVGSGDIQPLEVVVRSEPYFAFELLVAEFLSRDVFII